MSILLAHYGVYALTNVVLLTINALTTPGNWWFLWVVWGWGILIASHAGSSARGSIGVHLLTFAVAGAGLVVVDVGCSDQRWFSWVVLPWSAILVLHRRFRSSPRRRFVGWEATLVSPGSDHGSGR